MDVKKYRVGEPRHYKAPQMVITARPTVFLAGSVEMGLAEKWQDFAASQLIDRTDAVVLNPRRDDWDSSWRQSIEDPQFFEQVMWELFGLDAAAIALFYFDPSTKSPITLLELGVRAASKPKSTVVACPPGFWRRGNVEITCDKFGVTFYETLSEAVDNVVETLNGGEV